MVRQVSDEPVRHELVQQTAVEEGVPIQICKPLPWDHRLQRRGLVIGHEPLVDREVRNSRKSNGAGTPRLLRSPLDRVVEVDRFLVGPRLALPRRLSRTARIDPDGDVALWNPPLGIDGFPVHEGICLLLEIFRRNPDLVLLIGTQIHDDREGPFGVGPENIGLQLGSIPHRDINVLLDLDPRCCFAGCGRHCCLVSRQVFGLVKIHTQRSFHLSWPDPVGERRYRLSVPVFSRRITVWE
jgi:hypothetical protein